MKIVKNFRTFTIWALTLRGFANNKGADQPAHPRSLISAVVIRLLERIIPKLVTSEISMFWLVSVAESRYVRNPEDRFCGIEAHIITFSFQKSPDVGS